MANEIKRSVCPYDCPDACGLLVEVADSRAVRVSGDPEHAFTRSTLCPKMNHYERTVHSPRRLTQPLLRTGAKGSGEFRPIAWAEALHRIAERWRGIIEADGAEAILPYSYAGTMGLIQRNAGDPFFHRLGASRLDRTICSPAKGAGWKAVMGDTPAPHPDDVADSDLVILWGIDAVSTNIHFLRGVRRARRSGAPVWLIETHETPTANVVDRTFLVRPGNDGALALGLMHLLVRDGLTDREFLAQHVQGFERLRDEVLPRFPPDRVSRLTGLSVATLEEMARAYGLARAPFIRVGSGLSRYANGAMTVRAIACLPAAVGAYGKQGGGCLTSVSTTGLFAMDEVLRPDFMARPTRIINMNRLGWALDALDTPRVRSLYVYSSNPAVVAPDQNAVLRGLGRDDLFTVVHERFLTDTARYADIVLPATSSLEHADIYRAYGSYCIQRAAAVVPPVGTSKSNWEVFGLLADAMGFDEPFFRQTADELIDLLLERSRPGWEAVGLDPRSLADGRAVEVRLSAEARGAYRTPSGKIEILNPREPHPLPDFIPPYGGDQPFRLMTAPARYGLNSSFRERDDLRRKEERPLLQMNPADARAKGLADGDPAVAFNHLGEVAFSLRVTSGVPQGVVVVEGVWWLDQCLGARSVNALTSQRLTDQGGGSTFYDNTVDVRPAAPAGRRAEATS
ncbi:MAG: molybdopterin-dependent oxidoreductase [candidate division NC10 bacterium]|nr:molybdopterin-dependent oxidoreductase [candidate division NC10 bacterium]